MTDNNNTTSRGFSYAEPILYRGNTYPSAPSSILDERGIERKGRIFTDANGQYYTLDANGNALPAMMTETLPEVEVRPSKEDTLSTMFSRYLTMGNDKSRVNNVPHREYNQHLTESALNGAKAHASWDKDHPNLSAWRDFATAIPFGVAATPLAGGLGETALGQAAVTKMGEAMANPLVEAANNAIGLGFGAHGAYNVSQGDVTPTTLLELAGFYPFTKSLTGLTNKGLKVSRGSSEAASISEDVYNKVKHNYPLKGETEIPTDIKAKIARKYTDFINSDEYLSRLRKAGLEDHWEYMKDLTNRRLNNNDYFPSKVGAEINNDPEIAGLSSVEPSSKNYGIVMQEDLPLEEIFPVGYHETAHWATGNAGTSDFINSLKYPFVNDPNVSKVGDIMRYNESIAPVKEWENVLRSLPKDISVDKATQIYEDYKYLSNPQELRARLYNIWQQAKDAKMSPEAFIDKYTKNGRITIDAPANLQQLGVVLSIDNIKKRINNFLGISAPIGISLPLLSNSQDE